MFNTERTMYSEDNSEELLSDDFEQNFEEDFEISQWANEVVDYSDSYGSDSSISYSAVNICGRPSKFPAYGDFAECFSLRKYGPSTETEFSRKDKDETESFHDFITIKYEHYVLPKAIKIYETYNPGTVFRIYCYCCALRKWNILWDSLPAPVEKKAREFCPLIEKINSPTRILRLELNHSLIDYYTGIDGVLLVGTKCKLPVESPISDQAILRGMIQKKLEIVQFKPQGKPSEAIEEFLKNDLNLFIQTVGLNSYAKDSEKNISPMIADKEKIISDIPYEVLFNVMSFLDLRTLFQSSQVCRSFRHLASDPLLYLEVNLKFYWHLANSCLLQTLSPRCSLIRKLDLSSCGYFGSIKSSDFTSFIRANGRTLTHLRLNSSLFLNTSCLETVCITCSNLTELSIRNYMNVTTERDFISLAMLSKLETLDLSRSGIDTYALLTIVRNNPNLQRLNVAFSSHSVSMDELCFQLSAYNHKIRSIDMWKSHHLTTFGVRALSMCPLLEELDVGWCLRDEASISDPLKSLIQNCKNITKLVLCAIRGISERDLENIAIYCLNLEELDLMGIVGVSCEKCVRILEACKNLKLLDISFCENIDHGNVMFWRNEYSQVCIKRSEVPNDG